MYKLRQKFKPSDQVLFESRYSMALHCTFGLIDKLANAIFHFKLINKIDLRILKFFTKNSHYFYGCFLGSSNRYLNLYQNAKRPKKFLKKVFYGQSFPLPQLIKLSQPLPKKFRASDEAVELAKHLNHDGIVLVRKDYTEFVDHLINTYEINFDNIDASPTVVQTRLNVLDEKIQEFLADPLICEILALYYKSQPFLHDTPIISMFRPNFSQPHTRELLTEKLEPRPGVAGWHFDTVNQVTINLALTNISGNTTRMQYARKGHKHLNIKRQGRWYSDEYIHDHFDIVDCSGSVGTVYIFDNNGPHRLYPVENSCRGLLQAAYTPGNDIRTFIYPEKDEHRISLENKAMMDFSNLHNNVFKYYVD